ncbi:MAG: patatin-like phospholipase family protein [Bacteroidia bacterium]
MRFLRNLRQSLLKNHLFRNFFFSFAFRLVLIDFKKNQFLLVFWLLLFGLVTNNIAAKYGAPFLFLGPEYHDHLSFASYFIVGFSCGGFIMAYNIGSYIKNGFRFPFLATMANPFMRYSLNNFMVPLTFIVVYSLNIISFLKDENVFKTYEIAALVLAFILGNLIFIFLSFTYFFRTNKDIYKMYGILNKPVKDDREALRIRKMKNSGERNPYLIKESRDWYVETFLSWPLRTKLVRPVRHYKKEMLMAVFRQNHRNASYFQAFTILSLILLGLLRHYSLFEIPAGASFFLLFTVFLMIFSSLYSWFRGWSTAILIVLILIVNYIHKTEFITGTSKAYGLNYSAPPAPYTYKYMRNYDRDTFIRAADIRHTIEILEKWKAKNTTPGDTVHKPRLVFINVSGGGLRSSLWSYYALSYIDSITQGKLMHHTELITGSSGGMIGAAYLRELCRERDRNEIKHFLNNTYINQISKDILNPIAFTVATSEWLIHFQKFKVNNQEFVKDRGYALEEKLNMNTHVFVGKTLGDYRLPEANAEIPMMIFSPSIVNDGRKLLISAQDISYLAQNTPSRNFEGRQLLNAIEYTRFFNQHDPMKTMFTSVLRMSATFPYISPLVLLPTEPRIEVMDAGLRDNYGLETSLQFMEIFNDWIAKNTSGVLIIQMRDKHMETIIDNDPPPTLFQSLSKPMGSFYGNLFQVQDFNQNAQIQSADKWVKTHVDILRLELQNETNDHISLSWHLTHKEKSKVFNSLTLPENQESISKISKLLSD